MRLRKARLAPLSDAEMAPQAAETLAPMKARRADHAIFRTLARNPQAFARFMDWGRYILAENSLPPRQREMAILRTGWLARAGYEWAQHVRIGLREGLSEDEIARLKRGGGAGWDEADAALIDACDDLVRDQFVSDPVWSRLERHFTEQQLIDLVLTVGQYTMVSMALNSLGVQLDSWLTGDPDLEPRP